MWISEWNLIGNEECQMMQKYSIHCIIKCSYENDELDRPYEKNHAVC